MRIAVVSLLFASMSANAASDQEKSLSGDRPDFTDSTDTVAQGAGQLEAGVTYDFGAGSVSLPDALIRVGIHDSAEFRFATPSMSVGGEAESAGLDFGLGMKASTSVSDKFALGVLPNVDIGLGSAAFIAPSLTMLIGYDVADGFGVASNLGVSSWSALSGASESATLLGYYASLSTGLDLSDTVGLFAEVFGESSGAGLGWGYFADGGLTMLVSSNLQLDAHFGTSVDGAGSTWAGTGVVWLW